MAEETENYTTDQLGPAPWQQPVAPETKGERILLAAARRGEPAIFKKQWKIADRTIRGNFLRDLLVNAEARGVHPNGIMVAWAVLPDGLDVSHCQIDRRLGMINARFGAPLNLAHASTKALIFIDSTVPVVRGTGLRAWGDVSIESSRIGGEITLMGAEINGQLSLNESNLKNAPGITLNAQGIIVKGGCFMRGTTSEGEIDVNSATIFRTLALGEATLKNPGRRVLSCQRSVIKGSAFMHEMTAEGEINLISAEIGGQLSLNDATLENPDGHALDSQWMITKQGCFMDGLNAEGSVDMYAADVGGQLVLSDFEITSFHGEQMRVKGDFVFRRANKSSSPIINLNHAHVGTLDTDWQGWPQPGRLLLEGFTYDAFRFHQPWAKVKPWIERQPRRRYIPQPYEQAIKVYKATGHPADAREAAIDKEDAYTTCADITRWQKAWRYFFKYTVAYGYKSHIALGWIALVIGLSCMFFNDAYERGYMRPAKEIVLVNPCFQEITESCVWEDRALKWSDRVERVPKEYAEFSAFVYSADTFFPFVDLNQEVNWAPESADGIAWFYEIWLWVHIVLGWVLSTMAVVGFTGLVKQDS